MGLTEFIKLFLRHIRILLLTPILLGGTVMFLTKDPQFMYESHSTFYTGLASGSSIEMNKSFNYFTSNIAFDNLINIINSRETQEEVAVRLLTQHLLLPEADRRYISTKHYEEFNEMIPDSLRNFVTSVVLNEASGDFKSEVTGNYLFPETIRKKDFEKTVQALLQLMNSSNSNFVYELLNYDDPHYSIKALSTIKAIRISNSDMLKLSYKVNDPGICQQTLAIYNEVCIKNYKKVKENRSDAVVKYFENQLEIAINKLKKAENKLLEFNQLYDIINYNEQSKAVAHVKEDMEVDYYNNIAELAGVEASSEKLEEKLNIQHNIQLKSNQILEKRAELGETKFQIALLGSVHQSSQANSRLDSLNTRVKNLEYDIESGVDELYSFQNTLEGLPVTNVLPQWMDNVVKSENLKAKIDVMKARNSSFLDQYSTYSLAGANIKKIEREISVSEQGYLEILHGLNLAKLKLQDSELSSVLKTIDSPYYPLSPIPTKRKLIVIGTAFLGVIILMIAILFMEYNDKTLKNLNRATKSIGLEALGMFPKVLLNPKVYNYKFIQSRLLDIIAQKIHRLHRDSKNITKTILIISTEKNEGKSVIGVNIASKLKKNGNNVLVLNYSDFSSSKSVSHKAGFINKVLGYEDHTIDFNNSYLTSLPDNIEKKEYHKYTVKDGQNIKSYKDILKLNKIATYETPSYVIIELAPIINNNYPHELISNCDLCVLVCRSNRLWTSADQLALDEISTQIKSKMRFILNGVNLNEVESVLGELLKKRSVLRQKIKSMLTFQFYSKKQI